MGFLQDMIAKFKAKNQREKEIETELSSQEKVMNKQKSANERELERYGEEAREKAIERRLKWERGRRSKELWKANLMKNNARCYIDNSLNKERVNFLMGGKW